MSKSGPSIDFLDTANKFKGWALWSKDKRAWAEYNTVDFANKKMKTVYVKAKSDKGGKLQIHADNLDGAIIAEVKRIEINRMEGGKLPVSSF